MTKELKRPSDCILIGSTPWDSSWPELAKEHDRKKIMAYLENRFGINKSLFDDYILFGREKAWSLMRSTHHLAVGSQLKVAKVGLIAIRRVSSYLKPTTCFIQIFGHHATRARLKIDQDQLHKLISNEKIKVETDLDTGYIILDYQNFILGLGFYANGKISSQLPKKAVMGILRGL